MALNSNALINVAKAQAWGASSSTEVLEDLINAVSQAFENFTGRVFRQQKTVTGTPDPEGDPEEVALEYYQGTGTQELRLRRYPVTAIERVRIAGLELTEDEVSEITKLGHLTEEGWLRRQAGWPMVCLPYDDMTCDPNPATADYTIDVAYTGGYATIPSDLAMACLAEVLSGEKAGALARGNVTSEKFPGGYAVTYASDSRNWSNNTLSVLLNLRPKL